MVDSKRIYSSTGIVKKKLHNILQTNSYSIDISDCFRHEIKSSNVLQSPENYTIQYSFHRSRMAILSNDKAKYMYWWTNSRKHVAQKQDSRGWMNDQQNKCISLVFWNLIFYYLIPNKESLPISVNVTYFASRQDKVVTFPLVTWKEEQLP